jgi:phosphoesterase RecJ-like protein
MKSFVTELAEWLEDKMRILVLTHTKPDGDAVGSLFGMAYMLKGMHKITHIYLDAELPELYRQISAVKNLKTKIFVDKGVDVSSYHGVVILDAANAQMVSLKNVVESAKKHNVPVCVVDHHFDNKRYGDLNIVENHAAAAAVLADFAQVRNLEICKDTATCLLLGIMRDTGGFRFQNTRPLTLRLTAWLMEQGADYHGLTHKIFFSEPLNRKKFLSYVIEHKIQFACGHRVLYAVLEDEDFAAFNLHKKDMEGLIDTVRTIEGVVITCLFTKFRGRIKLSLRSSDERYPVNEIAGQIGGGGHKLAAGARYDGDHFEPAVSKFLSLVEKVFSS